MADTHNVITLESLRLEEGVFARDRNATASKTKICFSAEILSHELLHNAQFRAGLSQYPDTMSGYGAVLCEKLLELQAKLLGETMFRNVRSQETFRYSVQEKTNLLNVIMNKSRSPEKDFTDILWRNDNTVPSPCKLYWEQLKEVRSWNLIYAEQAFRNNYARFSADLQDGDSVAVLLDKIIRFRNMPVTADFLMKYAPVRAIPHGIACYEDGKKILE